jgi:iron(III) transport system substrate-binding protein
MNTGSKSLALGLTRRQLLLSGAASAIAGRTATAQTGDAAAFAALVKAAKEEGKVVLDGPPIDETREAIVNGFKAKYGIEVSYISSGSARSGARVRAERAAGKYLLDVFVSGSDTPLLTFLPSGWLDPVAPALIDPEVTDPKNWQDNRLWYVDPDRKIIRTLRYVTPTLAINSKLVAPGEIKGWKDVLNPKWRGKLIAKDPAVTGAGASLISYFYITFGPEFVKSLYVDQKPTISRDTRQAAQSLAVGNAPIWVGPDQTEVVRFQGLGYPIDWVTPNDGPGVVSGGWGFINLVNKAPNPNAAKLLINWLLSREGQGVFSKSVNSLTLRTDVDQSWIADYSRPKDGKEYIDTYDYKFVIEQRDPAFEKAQKLLGL